MTDLKTPGSAADSDETYAAEQRERLDYGLRHPSYDPQQQPDGTYRDAAAERRSSRRLEAERTSEEPQRPGPRGGSGLAPKL